MDNKVRDQKLTLGGCKMKKKIYRARIRRIEMGSCQGEVGVEAGVWLGIEKGWVVCILSFKNNKQKTVYNISSGTYRSLINFADYKVKRVSCTYL